MNRCLELRSEPKRSPLSSYITHYDPIFAFLKMSMRHRKRMVPLLYRNSFGYIEESGKDMRSRSYIKVPLPWYTSEPVEIKFKCIRSDITPMSKMDHYSSTCIYH